MDPFGHLLSTGFRLILVSSPASALQSWGFAKLARAWRYHCLWRVSGSLLPLSLINTAFRATARCWMRFWDSHTLWWERGVIEQKADSFRFLISVFCSRSWNLAVSSCEFAAVTLFFDAAGGASGLGMFRPEMKSWMSDRVDGDRTYRTLEQNMISRWDCNLKRRSSLSPPSGLANIDWFNVRVTVSYYITFTRDVPKYSSQQVKGFLVLVILWSSADA